MPGALDYGTCAFLALAPSLLHLPDTYATVCYLLAAGCFAISLLTNMPLGAVCLSPFPMHGNLELVSGLVFMASPWLFDFANESGLARNLFVALGVVFLLMYFFTGTPKAGRPTTARLAWAWAATGPRTRPGGLARLSIGQA